MVIQPTGNAKEVGRPHQAIRPFRMGLKIFDHQAGKRDETHNIVCDRPQHGRLNNEESYRQEKEQRHARNRDHVDAGETVQAHSFE